jgi:large subunit ribosomal protein L5
MTDTAPPARLKVRYLEEIRPALIERFGYSSVMQAPKLVKITLNMGVGLAKQDSKVLKAATEQLATIAGQQPNVRRARKSIAAFKLREGMPVGVAATLRGERSYEFLDRLVTIAIPRIRDFRGLSPRSFDGRGNYSMGVREQIIFPEIDYDAIDQVRGLDITITTSASTDVEAFALLSAMGMPFAAQGRPAGFDPEGAQADEAAATNGSGEETSAADAAEPQAAAEELVEEIAEPETAQPEAAEPEAAEPEAAEAVEQEAAEPEIAEPEAAEAAEPQSARPQAEAEAEADGAPSAEPNDSPENGESDTTEKESKD